jgi:hypothetical protein
MTKSKKGAPPPRKTQSTEMDLLVDAAAQTPGEWFSVENPANSVSNTYGMAYRAVAQRYVEVKVTGDRVYMRYHE